MESKVYKGTNNLKVGDDSQSTGLSENSSLKYCWCGIRARMCTSSKGKAVGRKFYGCSNYGKESFCGFFKWIESLNMLENAENYSALLNLKNTEVELHMMKAKAHELEAQLDKMTKKNAKLKNDLKCVKENLRRFETREKWFILVIGVFFVLFMSMFKTPFLLE